MRTIVIDCADVTTPAEFWSRYVDIAQPDSAHQFGRNLDAFWDAVEAGGPGWPGKVRLVFRNSEGLAAFHLPGGENFLEALRQIALDATEGVIEFA